MKRSLKMLAIFGITLVFTGCVKVEFSMGIHKDKSMDLEVVEAVDVSLLDDEESMLDASSLEQAENQGFLIRKYTDDSMQGYILTKTFENIDDLSTEEVGFTSDFDLVLEEASPYLFSIKKGFFKNTYMAKLKISSDDMSDSFNFDTENNFQLDDNEEDYDSDDIELDFDSDFMDDFDYSQMMSGMEMKFVLDLPYKVISSNATSIDNNGKKLTWDLLTNQAETIDFEFELYNMTNIYIVAGVSLFVVVLLVCIIMKKVGKGNSSKPNVMMSNSDIEQNYYSNNQNNIDYSDHLSYSNPLSNSSSTDNSPSDNLSSGSMFFSSQKIIEQTNDITNSNPSQSVPSHEFSSLDNGNINDSSNSDKSDSILSALDSLNYTNSTNMQDSSVAMQNQNINGQSTTMNQNSGIDNNSFFGGSNH